MTRILLVPGPDLTHPGQREPAIYGTTGTAGLDGWLAVLTARTK